MTITEIQELVRAGFTKNEILALAGSTSNLTPTKEVTSEETNVVETKEEHISVEDKAKVEKVEETKSTPQTNVNFAPMMTDAQIEKLAQMLNRGTASIDLPQAKPIDETLSEHFKNLMIGKE